MQTRFPLLLLLILASVGCKKMSASAPPYGDEAADGYATPAQFQDAASPPATDVDFDTVGTPTPQRELATTIPALQAEAGVWDGTAPEPAIEDHRADAPRQIVYTATLAISVFNVPDALLRAEALPERHGGWVARMNGETIVMKIPSAQLRDVMDELSELGIVEYRTLESDDVSDRYYDLQTRITVLETTQQQMMALLSKASNVTEALAVRRALDDITLELEVLKGQMRQLKNQVSFSTLTLSLAERGPHDPVPTSNDPFPWVDELGVEATEWR